jgi:hypothetical protein
MTVCLNTWRGRWSPVAPPPSLSPHSGAPAPAGRPPPAGPNITQQGRWVAKLAAHLLATAAHPDISQKIQNGRHKQRSGQHTVTRQTNVQNSVCRFWFFRVENVKFTIQTNLFFYFFSRHLRDFRSENDMHLLY